MPIAPLVAAVLAALLATARQSPIQGRVAAPTVAAEHRRPAVHAGQPRTALVRRAQQALHDQGAYLGPISGRMSRAFEEALRKVQRRNGIPPTGRLDAETLARIGS